MKKITWIGIFPFFFGSPPPPLSLSWRSCELDWLNSDQKLISREKFACIFKIHANDIFLSVALLFLSLISLRNISEVSQISFRCAVKSSLPSRFSKTRKFPRSSDITFFTSASHSRPQPSQSHGSPGEGTRTVFLALIQFSVYFLADLAKHEAARRGATKRKEKKREKVADDTQKTVGYRSRKYRDEEETAFGESAARETLAPHLNVQSECTCVCVFVCACVCTKRASAPARRRDKRTNRTSVHSGGEGEK